MAIFSNKARQKVRHSEDQERQYTVLLVDDERANLLTLQDLLSPLYKVLTASSGDEALAMFTGADPPPEIQVIIADQRMPGLSGVDLLINIRELDSRIKGILLTGYANHEVVARSIRSARVFDYFTKPYERDELLDSVKAAIAAHFRDVEQEQRRQGRFGDIVGDHDRLLATLDLVSKVADSDYPVLIQGETGTGKELIARAVYLNSNRAAKPFVTIHCGALPESLFEAELFGHRKGAFTGAQDNRPGRIAHAHGGTLFLDEVAEIPLTVQAKLLRFFQYGEFQRVGSDQVEVMDVRIVAATHQDLAALVAQGTFREDLYFRLKVVEIEVPPLRERPEDIPLLVRAFLDRYWRRDERPRLARETLSLLHTYAFPGNVRELEHIVKRACLLAEDGVFGVNLLPPEVHTRPLASSSGQQPDLNITFPDLTREALNQVREEARRQAAEGVERIFLEQLMAECKGNVTAAAKKADMQRTYLHRLLARHGIRP